jgi:hypothetical protein
MDSRAEGVQIGNVEPYKSTSLLKFDSIMVKAWWEIELLMWIAQCQKPTIWEWLIPSIKKKHILVMVHYWVSHIALLYSQYSKIYILATLATRRLTSRALQNQARDAVEL